MKSNSRVVSFEDLTVYQRARQLARAVYEVTSRPPLLNDFPMRNQLRRASLSVLCNIAEGFERGSNPEFCRFLYMAKGSAAEVRAQLLLCIDLKYLNFDSYQELNTLCLETSKMLAKLINYLKSTPLKNRTNTPSTDRLKNR